VRISLKESEPSVVVVVVAAGTTREGFVAGVDAEEEET
jgi:hypothetical protein